MKLTLGRKTAAIAAVAALALSAVGCQQQSDKGSGGASSSAMAPLKSTAWDRADADKVKDGGQLTLQVDQLPDNWNSDQADGALLDLQWVRDPMGYFKFLVVGEDGTVSFNPDYIVSAKLKSQSPEVVELKFNPKAVWEDGSPITINDLKAEAAANSGKDPAYSVASTVGWKDIASVTQTADQFTGEITFTNPVVDWQNFAYPSIPASISTDPKAFNEGYTKKSTPSQGPYKVKSVDTDGQVITLEKNPKWWGTPGKLDTIIFKVVTQAQSPQAFANSELDAIQVANGNVYNTAKSRSDAELQKSNGLTWTHVTLNTKHGALADPAVRKAIAYAINRTLIAKAVVGPFEAPVNLVDNPIYMPGQKGYKDVYEGALASNHPDQAEKFLKDAGYVKGSDGVYAKDGNSLTFAITVPASAQSNADRAAQIQRDLNAVGFKITLNTVPSDQYFKSYVTPKNFDMVTFSWVGTLFPVSSAPNTFSPVDSAQNYTNYADPEIATVYKQANSEFDPAKRIDLANQMAKLMLDEYAIIPFYATPNVYAVKKGLANYGASQFETLDWSKIGWLK